MFEYNTYSMILIKHYVQFYTIYEKWLQGRRWQMNGSFSGANSIAHCHCELSPGLKGFYSSESKFEWSLCRGVV